MNWLYHLRNIIIILVCVGALLFFFLFLVTVIIITYDCSTTIQQISRSLFFPLLTSVSVCSGLSMKWFKSQANIFTQEIYIHFYIKTDDISVVWSFLWFQAHKKHECFPFFEWCFRSWYSKSVIISMFVYCHEYVFLVNCIFWMFHIRYFVLIVDFDAEINCS